MRLNLYQRGSIVNQNVESPTKEHEVKTWTLAPLKDKFLSPESSPELKKESSCHKHTLETK